MNKERKAVFISVAIIAAFGFAVYANSLTGEFIGDDITLVRDNTFVRSWLNFPGIFTKDVARGGQQEWNSYRPVQMMTYMMDHSLWGLDVRGYHITNVALHIFAAMAIYWLINIISGDKLLSLVASLLFVASPLHTEAISYISGRADPLSAFFMALSFIFYIRLLAGGKPALYLIMILCYILALLSKENSLMLPALFLLYHYISKRRLRPVNFFPVAGIAAAYILIRLTVLRPFLFNIVYDTTFLQRLPGVFAAIAAYSRLLLLPLGLHVAYGDEIFEWGHPAVIAGIIILSALSFYLYSNRKSGGLTVFAAWWFLIAFLPQSNIYPLNAYMAEHWLYIPSVGFFLVIAHYISSLYRIKKFRIPAIAIVIALVTFYSCMTVRQNVYWREPVSFYERALKFAPQEVSKYAQLGAVYRERGDIEGAIAVYEKAIEIDPRFGYLYSNLGVLYVQAGRPDEAIPMFKKAIEISPKQVPAYNNLAKAYFDAGMKEEALELHKKALELDPENPYTYHNLGVVYSQLDMWDEAIESYKKAIEIFPQYTSAYANLSAAYRNTGDLDKAIAGYKEALAVDPGYALAHNGLAEVYFYMKEYGLAIRHLDRAIALGYKVHPGLLEDLKQHR